MKIFEEYEDGVPYTGDEIHSLGKTVKEVGVKNDRKKI
jgi:hypothetical protein